MIGVAKMGLWQNVASPYIGLLEEFFEKALH